MCIRDRPYGNRAFKKFLIKNYIEIPECMVNYQNLVIDSFIPGCQEFLTLMFESKIKLELPFTSCVIFNCNTSIDYRNTLSLLKTLKLKIKIPDEAIDGNFLFIEKLTPLATRLFSDGIKIEKHFSLKYATYEYLHEENY